MDVKESYQVLELEIGASRAAIEAAYVRMLEHWHPDRVPPASGPAGLEQAQRMVDRVNEAFRTLDKITPKRDQPAAASAPTAPARPRISPPLPEPVLPVSKPKPPPAFTPPPIPASPPPPASAPAPAPTPNATSRAQTPPKATTPTEENDEPDFLSTAWVHVEKMLPEDPKKRRSVLVGAAVALLLLVVLVVGKCSSTPTRKARMGPDPATIGTLIVKSNRAGATVEATLIPQSTADAPEVASGSVGEPIGGLTPGKYTVIARSAGWPDASVEASVQAGSTTEVVVDLASGSLRLDSLPTGATVRWGQSVLGRTPLVVEQLPLGECALTLEYPDWTPLKIKVAIAKNTEATETVRFPHGRLTVTSAPSGATVLLGKRNLGRTPLTLERFPAGARTLALQLKDFPPLEVNVTLADQGEETLRAVMANSFPLLDAPATLQAVWYELPAGDPNRLSPNFDPFPGFHPQGSFVRNLNRKKLFEIWLGRTYRFTGKIKSYNPANGQVEFAEQVSSLGKIRVAAQLLPAARDDKETVALLSTKEATITIAGRFSAMEEFDRRGRPFEIEFTQAHVVP